MADAKKATPASAGKRKADEEDDDDDEEEEEEKEAEPAPAKKKQRLDVEGNAAATNGGTDSTRVFVGNLSWKATEDDVRKHFKDCGKIVNVRMGVDPETGRSRGFAHVEFGDAAQAKKAVSKAGTEIDGRAIKVEVTQPRPQSFGGGGREDEIRSALEEVFGGCGGIKSIRLPSDREAGTLKGFAYIEFDSTEAKVRLFRVRVHVCVVCVPGWDVRFHHAN
ncbi:hypothetical protein VOLCADRAFT_54847 [Volvox carteri f. nagariensis]|uniref:RRM domain-containing protein n=1 Tax=Volvox carteri f. nagariensis TaxID=3068 RepID=D8TI62_VOLCA|nr:uncharacterized protein VOLCADRAFT_54847 [Volvox carteri f. nagariensis]EFJ52840.1 hypothetical protein VOLCADRAFT_54847 [Volvox carteri f. nagariensis]|eukprot:XP_002945845.1 hypothetical protein VOLCADRAFT_54847 [Volvox carteri f. nagariensis]